MTFQNFIVIIGVMNIYRDKKFAETLSSKAHEAYL